MGSSVAELRRKQRISKLFGFNKILIQHGTFIHDRRHSDFSHTPKENILKLDNFLGF